MKRLVLGLLVVGVISSTLFGYSIKYKNDMGGDSQNHNWNFTLNCNNGSTGYVTLSATYSSSGGTIYGATGDSGSYWHNGTSANDVFDKAARDACNE